MPKGLKVRIGKLRVEMEETRLGLGPTIRPKNKQNCIFSNNLKL